MRKRLFQHDYRGAFAIFDNILRHNPDSPRAHFGKARAFDIRSEMDADKAFLDMAINEYQEVLDCDDTPDALFRYCFYTRSLTSIKYLSGCCQSSGSFY
uniref:Tetratricopeptide repeat protein n=1 Tax=Parascaris equorum TaxID=6256 RepID=A0A914RGU3_PAREQ